jgi:hypothetical protein
LTESYALQTISCFIGFPVKLALGAEDAHHLGPLGAGLVPPQFRGRGRHFGLSVSPRLPNFGVSITDQTISMT